MEFFKDKEEPNIVELDDDALEAVTGGVKYFDIEEPVEEVSLPDLGNSLR